MEIRPLETLSRGQILDLIWATEDVPLIDTIAKTTTEAGEIYLASMKGWRA